MVVVGCKEVAKLSPWDSCPTFIIFFLLLPPPHLSFFQDTRAKAALVRWSASRNCFSPYFFWLPSWLPELFTPAFSSSSSLRNPPYRPLLCVSKEDPRLVCCTIVVWRSRSAFVYIIFALARCSCQWQPLAPISMAYFFATPSYQPV